MDVLNFLLWPFRQGIWFLKAALWLIAVFCVLTYCSIHWFHAGNADHKASLAHYHHIQTYSLDLRESFGTLPFRYTDENGKLFPPPAFCVLPNSPDDANHQVDRINDKTELSFKNMDVSWISRKSGKLYRSYVLAGMTVSTMRRYLAQLKAHHADQNLSCDVVRAENEIVLQLPVIQFSSDINQEDGGTYPGSMIILGMWVKGEGKPEDAILESNSHIADVHDPVLTPGQQKAFDLLDSVRSSEFWIKTAHENGINCVNCDLMVNRRAENLRETLEQRLPLKY